MGFALVASSAAANILHEMSREEKWNAAELVAVARPMTDCSLNGKARVDRCSMRVIETIKGKPVDEVELELENIIAEHSVSNCCVRGHDYLLYMKRWEGHWQSVNGRFGVRDLQLTLGRRSSP
jgi:hypothetical protein